MMRLFKSVLAAMLISLSISSAGCPANTPVQVPVPAPSCSPGTIPVFPRVVPEKCVDGEVELVCLTPADGAAIWAWARDMGRWAERAQVCADTRSLAFTGGVPVDLLAPARIVDLMALATKLADPRVHIEVSVEECGQENAFYHPFRRLIVFCTEMLAYGPATARFFLAHEIAHAYIVQLDLPFTGSHEAAADELAAYLMIRAGHAKDLLEAAKYWTAQAEETSVPGWADHPDHDQRAHTLRCLGQEATHGKDQLLCRGDLPRIQRNWAKILK